MTVQCPECDRVCRNEISYKIHYGSKHGHPLPWKDRVERNGPYFNKQRRKVLERDGHTCRRCGRINSYGGEFAELEVHHIIPFRKFLNPKSAHKVANLVSVCSTCHELLEGLPVEKQLAEIGVSSPRELEINEDSD